MVLPVPHSFHKKILKNSNSSLYVVDGEFQCHGTRSISTGSITSVSPHPATGSLPLPRRNHAPALLTLQSLPPPPPPPSGKIDPALVKFYYWKIWNFISDLAKVNQLCFFPRFWCFFVHEYFCIKCAYCAEFNTYSGAKIKKIVCKKVAK